MHSRLFDLFGEPVPAYFTMLMLGFALATLVGSRWAKRSGFDHNTVIDLGLYALIFGVGGARILHVIADGYFWDYVHLCTDPSKVGWQITHAECSAVEGLWDAAANVCRPAARDCFAWAEFWNGGLAYYGGLVAATIFGVYFLKKERFPLLKGADMVGMVVPLGLFFGRLGCFLGGCCFGQPVHEGVLSVVFPGGSPASEAEWKLGLLSSPNLASLPVYPTQLYESLGSLAIAAFCMLWVHPRKRFDGQVMLVFLALYAILRFVLEFYRADDRGGLFGMSTSQLIGVGILGVVAYLWGELKKRATPPAATPEA
ncbi:MAG: prolipoprotein diacylglyceryl transferase [Deltaproteobacteria bacterium]|nr:prolipoprotein diacylglyceryl transferase [Deltaproteobacteria bacterium]